MLHGRAGFCVHRVRAHGVARLEAVCNMLKQNSLRFGRRFWMGKFRHDRSAQYVRIVTITEFG